MHTARGLGEVAVGRSVMLPGLDPEPKPISMSSIPSHGLTRVQGKTTACACPNSLFRLSLADSPVTNLASIDRASCPRLNATRDRVASLSKPAQKPVVSSPRTLLPVQWAGHQGNVGVAAPSPHSTLERARPVAHCGHRGVERDSHGCLAASTNTESSPPLTGARRSQARANAEWVLPSESSGVGGGIPEYMRYAMADERA